MSLQANEYVNVVTKRWRDCARLICVICWVISVPVFFLPEPERNAMNKEGALSQIEQIDQKFKHVDQSDDTVDGVHNTTETVS